MTDARRIFEASTYLSQTRRLRLLAAEALKLYPVTPVKIKFINHGENATFQITAKNKKKYLLRIHRHGYHSKDALEEELDWLSFLARKGKFTIPTPVKSKRGRKLEAAAIEAVGPRHLCLFEWIEGRFIDTGVTHAKMYNLGQMIGRMQINVPRKKPRHRPRWDSDGLLGSPARFGNLDKLNGIAPEAQKTISRLRRIVHGKLHEYQKRFPKRMGLIHADLHFGNLLWLNAGEFGAIDFDDCGYGFHAYDLVMPVISMEMALGRRRKKHGPAYRKALIDGYRSVKKWDRHDDAILPHLISARRLMMLAWINSRSDNPKFAKLLKPRVRRVIKRLSAEYDLPS